MYSAEMLDHFQNPRCAGAVEDPDAVSEVSNPACGDVLRLSLRIRNGRIEQASFLARGCVATVACGSAMASLIDGQTIHHARALTRDHIIAELGSIPPASFHAAALAMDALSKALNDAE